MPPNAFKCLEIASNRSKYVQTGLNILCRSFNLEYHLGYPWGVHLQTWTLPPNREIGGGGLNEGDGLMPLTTYAKCDPSYHFVLNLCLDLTAGWHAWRVPGSATLLNPVPWFTSHLKYWIVMPRYTPHRPRHVHDFAEPCSSEVYPIWWDEVLHDPQCHMYPPLYHYHSH